MQRVRNLLQGNELFRKTYFLKNEDSLQALARKGQSPKVLFIGCADSRVIPSMITGADPGSLFVLRNVGNFVAPYKPDEDFHAMAAGNEYAVNRLRVDEIVVCGHTNCGAIAALYDGALDRERFVHTRKWLSLGQRAKDLARETLGADAEPEALIGLTEQLSVVTQLDHLLTYPYVREQAENGRLYLHGWMYDIKTGGIACYDPERQAFLAPKETLTENAP